MKKISFFIVISIVLLNSSLFILSQVLAADKEYIMKGKIKAIENQYNTVVIEVPLGKKQFTVGGPLSPNAVLRKKGQTVKLSDFKEGDTVTARWPATASGHIIERLEVK